MAGEQELLSIVETLKEFRNILLGQEIIVHTDHKNIIYGNLSNNRVAGQRLLLEEFGPTYKHIAGKDNIIADALSRMEANFNKAPAKISIIEAAQTCAAALTMLIQHVSYDIPDPNDCDQMAHAFGQSEDDDKRFPLRPILISTEQKTDKP